MTQEDMQDVARRQPFVPFRVVLTTGATFDIPHPDLIMIGERSAVLGIPKKPDATAYYRTVTVDLFHIVSVEPLISATPTANGFHGEGA